MFEGGELAYYVARQMFCFALVVLAIGILVGVGLYYLLWG